MLAGSSMGDLKIEKVRQPMTEWHIMGRRKTRKEENGLERGEELLLGEPGARTTAVKDHVIGFGTRTQEPSAAPGRSQRFWSDWVHGETGGS